VNRISISLFNIKALVHIVDRLCGLVAEILATNPEIPGALSLVRIIEELPEWKSSGSGLGNRD
jgi:hypothetical protein